jgi:hypothetical protein
MSNGRTIYVRLLNEGVDVRRPIQAEHLADHIYRILDQPYDRSIEHWEFEPGDHVVCTVLQKPDGPMLAAVRRVDDRTNVADLWRRRLAVPSSIHLIERSACDVTGLLSASNDIGFTVFELDASRVRTPDDLMSELARVVQFPSYFGRNWDATLDLLTDLSWIPAKGYALIITASDELARIGTQDLIRFVQVLGATIHVWRDERGEYAERTSPVPFHVMLCGATNLKEMLSHVLTDPFCEH